MNEAVVSLGLGAVASIAMRTAIAPSLQRSLPGEAGALATTVRVADEVAHAIDHTDDDGDDHARFAVPRRAMVALTEIGIDTQHHVQVIADVEKHFEWVQGLMAG